MPHQLRQRPNESGYDVAMVGRGAAGAVMVPRLSEQFARDQSTLDRPAGRVDIYERSHALTMLMMFNGTTSSESTLADTTADQL